MNGIGLKGEPSITRQMLRLIGQPFTVRIDKAKRDLGYEARVSWRQGIDEMCAISVTPPVDLGAT